MILRVGHCVVARKWRIVSGLGRPRHAQCVPHVCIEREIEVGQDHPAPGQARHHAQQPRHRGRGAGHPGGEYRVQRWIFAPAPRGVIEQAVAAFGRIDLAAPVQYCLPFALERGEQVSVGLPVPGKIGKQIAHPVREQVARGNAFHRQPIDAACDVARQAEQSRRRGRSVIRLLAQHFSQAKPARRGIACGRDVCPRTDRIEQCAQCFVKIEIADYRHAREQQSGPAGPHERLGQRPHRALARQHQRQSRQPEARFGIARDQPRNERIGETAMRGDRPHVQRGRWRVSHSPYRARLYPCSSASSVGAIASGEPTSNHSPMCDTPYRRPSAIARFHSTIVPNGPAGASRSKRCETSWIPE